MKTENFFWAKYQQCGKCWTMNRKSSLTQSGEDFKTSKQHYGLCELLNKKSQEILHLVWLGTTTSSRQHARKNIMPEVLSSVEKKEKNLKNQKNYYAQRWYRLQWIRILSTFENLMAERYFKSIYSSSGVHHLAMTMTQTVQLKNLQWIRTAKMSEVALRNKKF